MTNPVGTVTVRTRTWPKPAAATCSASRSGDGLTPVCQAGSR